MNPFDKEDLADGVQVVLVCLVLVLVGWAFQSCIRDAVCDGIVAAREVGE